MIAREYNWLLLISSLQVLCTIITWLISYMCAIPMEKILGKVLHTSKYAVPTVSTPHLAAQMSTHNALPLYLWRIVWVVLQQDRTSTHNINTDLNTPGSGRSPVNNCYTCNQQVQWKHPTKHHMITTVWKNEANQLAMWNAWQGVLCVFVRVLRYFRQYSWPCSP
jgi:hypothetical protein